MNNEIGIKYTLTGPNGGVAVFNDQTDPNYVGALTEVTGFDNPDVRENADDLVQMDGGIHGDFFYGRRPITMTGLILNPASATERNARSDKLTRAADALRADATLAFTPSGGVPSVMWVRKNQPTRITGAWQKQFQLALVAADPRIYSSALHTSTVSAGTSTPVGRSYDKGYGIDYGPASPVGQALVTNAGTTLTYPVLTITGPASNPQITNMTTGQRISLIYTLADGEQLVVDTLNRTVRLGGTTDRYGAVDFGNTSWWGLVPGVNDIRLASFSSGASLRVDWRDAWL